MKYFAKIRWDAAFGPRFVSVSVEETTRSYRDPKWGYQDEVVYKVREGCWPKGYIDESQYLIAKKAGFTKEPKDIDDLPEIKWN